MLIIENWPVNPTLEGVFKVCQKEVRKHGAEFTALWDVFSESQDK
jgi:hypothetical protein